MKKKYLFTGGSSFLTQNWINYLAYQEPKLYGVACIIIAISFGFGASLVFRKKI